MSTTKDNRSEARTLVKKLVAFQFAHKLSNTQMVERLNAVGLQIPLGTYVNWPQRNLPRQGTLLGIRTALSLLENGASVEGTRQVAEVAVR